MMKPPPENGVGDDSSQSQGQDVERSTTSSPATPAPTPIRGGGAFTSFFDSPMSKLASMFSGLRIGNIFQNRKVNKGAVDEQGETPEQEESESFNEDAHHDQNESSGVEYEEARLEVGPTGADEEEVEIGNKEEQDQDESIISELETTTNKIMKEGPEIITTTVPAVEIEKEKKDEEPKAVPVVECENVEKEESEIEKVETVEEPKSTPELEIDEAEAPESIPELEKAKGELQSTPELIDTEELKQEEESKSMHEPAAEVDVSPPECPGCRGCETEDDDQGSSLVVKMSIFDAHSNPPPTTEPLIELPLDKDAAQEMLKPAEIQDMLTLQ